MLEVLAAMAEKKGSLLARHGPEWFTQDLSDRFRFVYNHVEMTLPHPNLQGVHQIANAGAAIAALQIIKDQFPVSDDSIRKGLKKIKWPARLQNLTGQFPLPEGWEIWLDGGHNENAAHALATQTAIWNAQDAKPLHLVLGMMRRKDPAAFVKILRNHLTSVTFIDIPDEPQIISADEGAEILKEKIPDLKTSATMSIETALCDIATANHHTPPGRILIAGSLYLAGHVLKQCGKTP
jgi:dihydrofolate synthase/folylpolyglutamate synthase